MEALGFEISKVHHKKETGKYLTHFLNCTKEMTCNHLNKLAEELIKTNIFIDAIYLETGVLQEYIDPTRVYNHDKTLQFVNYRVDSTPNGLMYAG